MNDRRFESLYGRSIVIGFAMLCSTPFMAVGQSQPIPVDTLRLSLSEIELTDTYFGTVRARDISSLSYASRGCIVDVSEEAKHTRLVNAGQVLVKLDDQRVQLAMRTAESRVLELQAAIDERQLALQAARADERRRFAELAFVTEEFQRNSVMQARGLINESTMETIERRHMDAEFAVERATEAIANAETAVKRAEIALVIGLLDQQSATINLADADLVAPFDGVLVGFEANVGDCVQEGELAARIYDPSQKSVDVFFPISRLTAAEATGLTINSTVTVTRVNDQACEGTITRLDTEADPETQFVEATIDVDTSCAPNLFLNEAVEIEALRSVIDNAVTVPNSAIQGESTVFLVDEESQKLMKVSAEVISRGVLTSVLRIPDADGRLLVLQTLTTMADGAIVRLREPG